MKLILCQKCQDVFKLSTTEERTCACGACEGAYYEDGLYAWFKGEDAIPIFFSNPDLVNAIYKRSKKQYCADHIFTAGVIEIDCPTLSDLTEKKS